MKLSLKAGTTSKTVNIFMQDSSSTTGAGLTGLAFNTASLTAYYALQRAAATSITLATQTVTGAWSSGGFVEISSANMPGWYRFDIPDAALASGTFSSIHFKGATNLAPLPIEIELTAWDNQDTVRGGLTALPNVASGSAGAIPTTGTGSNQISVSSGQVILQTGTGTGQLDFTSGVVKANTTQLAAQTVTAAAGVTFPTSVASPTNITAGTITTVTNLTNAPTAGDLTATMKTSVTTACTASTPTAAAVTGAVGSVTGAVTLNAKDSLVVRNNTATAGAAATITLDGSASAVDTFYVGCLIKIDSGTGLGQARIITNYVGSTKVATVDRIWATNPDATSVFTICTSDSPKTNGSLEVISNSVTGAVGSVTLVSANAIGATSVSTAGQNAAADGILDRVMSAGVDSGGDNTTARTVRQALRTIRNKVSISAGTMTCTKEDDSTACYTAAVTTTAGNPISAVDPT